MKFMIAVICLLSLASTVQASQGNEREASDFEKQIAAAVTANKAVQRGEDQKIAFSKLSWKGDESMYVAFTAKHYVGITDEGYPILLLDFFLFREKDGKMKSSIMWQDKRFVVEHAVEGPVWVGWTGQTEAFSIAHLKTSELPTPLAESYSNEIFYRMNDIGKGNDQLGDLDIPGKFGACRYKHDRESQYNCHFMKESQCNYKGALELGADKVTKSTREFKFFPGEICAR